MSSLVISPHLDDAVLSIGGGIALAHDVTVATVLAGVPPLWSWPTPFDSASGFDRSDVAVRSRRMEDWNACEWVRARPLWFDWYDGQYGLDRDEDAITATLTELFRAYTTIAVPLGLAHPDHRLVARCCRAAMLALPMRVVLVYEDLPSARLYPSHVPGALRGWSRAGFVGEQLTWAVDLDAKRSAVDAYVSQRRFPELAWENLTEERGWAVHLHDD